MVRRLDSAILLIRRCILLILRILKEVFRICPQFKVKFSRCLLILSISSNSSSYTYIQIKYYKELDVFFTYYFNKEEDSNCDNHSQNSLIRIYPR